MLHSDKPKEDYLSLTYQAFQGNKSPWYHSWHLCRLCLPLVVVIGPQHLWASFTVSAPDRAEGNKGTSGGYPAWPGRRKFCRFPALILSFPLLTLLFPPSPTLETTTLFSVRMQFLLSLLFDLVYYLLLYCPHEWNFKGFVFLHPMHSFHLA